MNYFDHAASTFIYPKVLEVLNKTFRDDFANPNSKHNLGVEILSKIDNSRFFFLNTLGGSKDDLFVFTSSATESNNIIIQGLDFKADDIIYYSKADHPSLVEPIEKLAQNTGLKLKNIKLLNDGSIDIEEFKGGLNPSVKLVALAHVNHQSGAIVNLDILGKLIKEKTKAHFHLDCAQSFTKISFLVGNTIDSVSITSHKVGGPKGIAGLFIKKNLPVRPLMLGGGQELGFRPSTQSYPLIAAFSEATRISIKHNIDSYSKLVILNHYLKENLKRIIPQIKCPFENASPFIFSFIIPEIPSDVILRQLETRGFFLSSTSACSSRQKGFNPTLDALNIAEVYHKNVLRISFGHETTHESIDLLLQAFDEIWNDLKFLIKK